MTNALDKGRYIFRIGYILLGVAAGAITVWQFAVPTVREDAYLRGKSEIAAEVVAQLNAAGFDTSAAETALQSGDLPEAVSLATQATLAPAVPAAYLAPFVVSEGEVIDLPTGETLSFSLESNIGARSTIRLKINGVQSSSLKYGDMFPLQGTSNCSLDILQVDVGSGKPYKASFRVRCL